MRLCFRNDNVRAAIQLHNGPTTSGSEFLTQEWIDEFFGILRNWPSRRQDASEMVYIRADSEGEARALMMEFNRQAGAHYRGDLKEIHSTLLEWVASHLDALARDERASARKAIEFFHITKRGRPEKNRARNVDIMQMVEVSRRGGLSMMEACVEVADQVGIDDSNVKKIYLRLRNSGLVVNENGEVEPPF